MPLGEILKRETPRVNSRHHQAIKRLADGLIPVAESPDGLIEVRRDGEQYGIGRLDAALAAGQELPAKELAEHVVADARRFAGEPGDDYAVVVIRRS